MTFYLRGFVHPAENGVTYGRSSVKTILTVGIACVVALANLWISRLVANPNQTSHLVLPPIEKPEKSSIPKDVTESKSVRFIPLDQIPDETHYFSAAWWQSKERFMRTLEPSRIGSLEAAVFSFIYPDDLSKDLRMTSDWLNFSVEHLSHYWKMVTGFEKPKETQAYHMLVEKTLDHKYRTLTAIGQNEAGIMFKKGLENPTSPAALQSAYSKKNSSSSAMMETIAVIAFGPYKSDINVTRGQVLTTAVLASTVASLIHVYCGRLLIVVEQSDLDEHTAQIMVATKHVLLQHQGHRQQQGPLHHEAGESISEQTRIALESFFMSSSSSSLIDVVLHVNATNVFEYKVHHTEIAVVVVQCKEEDGTKNDGRLIQKAVSIGLKKAFEGDDVLYTQQWLGQGMTSTNRYNYTYFTEGDTILHAKLDAMAALSVEVRNGRIVVPHRLQPIPHERDLPGYHRSRIVPCTVNRTSNASACGSNRTTTYDVAVMNMGANDVCCDAGPAAPGFVQISVCGRYWWTCGYRSVEQGKADEILWNATRSQRHFRLAHYKLMDLREGTHIVLLAGSEHGRQCVPKKASTASLENSQKSDC